MEEKDFKVTAEHILRIIRIGAVTSSLSRGFNITSGFTRSLK